MRNEMKRFETFPSLQLISIDFPDRILRMFVFKNFKL